MILHSCVPSSNPAFSLALLAFRLPAHSAQLHSWLLVRVSVALYVMLPQSHRHFHNGTFRFPRGPNLSDLSSTVSILMCWPVRSRCFRQPQLSVCPRTKFDARTTHSLPQLHLHSQRFLPPVPSSAEAGRIAVRRPNVWPVRSSVELLLLCVIFSTGSSPSSRAMIHSVNATFRFRHIIENNIPERK